LGFAFRHIAGFRCGLSAFFTFALSLGAGFATLRPALTPATTATTTAATATLTFLGGFLTRIGARAIGFLFLGLWRDVFHFRRVIHAERGRCGGHRHGFSGAQAFNAQRRPHQLFIRLEENAHAKARLDFRKPVALAVQKPKCNIGRDMHIDLG
jgi:hypothetical protein